MTTSIQGGVGQFGAAGRPSFTEMKAKFSQMKEQMRGTNPDMAKKMDAFESKVNALTENGMSAEDAAKSVGKELGLPDPSQMMGKGMGGFGGAQMSFSGYDSKGQGAKNDSVKYFLDLLS